MTTNDEREEWWMTDAEIDYFNTVDRDQVTCEACPYQVEGTLKDGSFFYFRYRWGYASLAVGSDVDTVLGHSDIGEQIGDGLDGYMAGAEYRASFMRLHNQLMGL